MDTQSLVAGGNPPTILALRVGAGTFQRRNLKPRPCYDVIATTDQGDMLAARFTSRRRADQFVRYALDRIAYRYADANDRYQAKRLAPGATEPVFGWGYEVSIMWFVDEPLTGEFGLRWDEMAVNEDGTWGPRTPCPNCGGRSHTACGSTRRLSEILLPEREQPPTPGVVVRVEGSVTPDTELVVVCGWFAACANPAVGIVSHPILKYVPVCQRCADRLGPDLIPAEFQQVGES